MKIVIRDVEYKVRFRHDPPDLFERETVCDFFDGEKLRYTGWAVCVEGDQFNRATGRRIALTRAIANLPREDRTEVWKQYFAAIKGREEWRKAAQKAFDASSEELAKAALKYGTKK